MASPEKNAVLAWARQHLGLTSDATPGQVRTTFLRRVQQEGLVPQAATDYAFRALTSDSEPAVADLGWQQARADIEAKLRQEVDAFASRFFELEPGERQRQWEDLRSRCEWAEPLRAYLDLLAPALAIVPADMVGGEAPQARLAALICELFVLRPVPWARRRQELCATMAEKMNFWQSIALELRESAPELAALEPDLIAFFADRDLQAKRVEQIQKQIVRDLGRVSDHTWWIVLVGLTIVARVLWALFSQRN